MSRLRLEHVATAHPALGHGPVGVGDLVQRHDRVHSGGQLAGRGAGEQVAQSRTVGVRDHDVHGDPALCGRLGARLDADEGPAVADQGEALLLQHRAVGDRVPARLGAGGEPGAEAADELLVLGSGQTGHLPAAVRRERGDVPPDRAGRPGHQQPVAVGGRVAEQVDNLGGGKPVERHRRRRGQVQPVGHDGEVGGGYDELLGVGAEVTVEAVHHAGDPGADGQVDAGAGGDDGAGEVPAQAGPLGLVDQPHGVEEAARDREVDGVDRRGGDPNPDLAGPGLDDGNVDDLDRVGSARSADDGGAEGGGAHVSLLAVVSDGCPTPLWRSNFPTGSTHFEVGRFPLGGKERSVPTMTAAQQRARARVDYDAFLAGCPSRQLLARISDKWVALILAALGSDGPHDPGVDCVGEPRSMRYSELSRRLAGVSQKMLTQTLRSLERDGLLTRTVTPTVPVTVTYELTALGRSLQQVMRGIKEWAEANMDEVLNSREEYDTRSRPAVA